MNPFVLVTLSNGLALTRVIVEMPDPIKNTKALLNLEKAVQEQLEKAGYEDAHLFQLIGFQRLEADL